MRTNDLRKHTTFFFLMIFKPASVPAPLGSAIICSLRWERWRRGGEEEGGRRERGGEKERERGKESENIHIWQSSKHLDLKFAVLSTVTVSLSLSLFYSLQFACLPPGHAINCFCKEPLKDWFNSLSFLLNFYDIIEIMTPLISEISFFPWF